MFKESFIKNNISPNKIQNPAVLNFEAMVSVTWVHNPPPPQPSCFHPKSELYASPLQPATPLVKVIAFRTSNQKVTNEINFITSYFQ